MELLDEKLRDAEEAVNHVVEGWFNGPAMFPVGATEEDKRKIKVEIHWFLVKNSELSGPLHRWWQAWNAWHMCGMDAKEGNITAVIPGL